MILPVFDKITSFLAWICARQHEAGRAQIHQKRAAICDAYRVTNQIRMAARTS